MVPVDVHFNTRKQARQALKRTFAQIPRGLRPHHAWVILGRLFHLWQFL